VIRLFSIEVALFLAPFVLYALFLWATREGILHPDQWRPQVLAALSLAAIALTVAGFVLIAEYTGAPAHSTYVPAHLENGQLVPGTTK
jgi:ATP/ADP translocase